MNILLIIVAIIAIALAVIGGFAKAVGFLLWIGLGLLLLAIIAWALRMLFVPKS